MTLYRIPRESTEALVPSSTLMWEPPFALVVQQSPHIHVWLASDGGVVRAQVLGALAAWVTERKLSLDIASELLALVMIGSARTAFTFLVQLQSSDRAHVARQLRTA